MKDQSKTKQALIQELASLRKTVAELEQSEEERKRTDEALRKSEGRYKRLLDSVTDYIYTVEVEDGRPVATAHGPGCAAVTGYTSEDYRADPYLWHRMVYTDDRGIVTEHAAGVIAGKSATALEHRIVHRDGSVRWVRNTPVPHYDEQNRLVSYEGLISNITERKQVEEALQVSQVLQKAIVDSTSDMIWSVDPVRFGLFTFNHGLRDYFYQQRGMHIKIGDRPEELFPPGEFVERWHEMYHRALIEEVYSLEYQAYAGTRTLELNFNLLKRENTVIGISVFGKDITERKRDKEALYQSEENYRSVFENATDAIFIVQDSLFRLANSKTLMMSGYPLEKLLNIPFIDLVHPDDRTLVMEQYKKRMQGEPVTAYYTCRIIHKNGDIRLCEVNAVPVSWEGKPASLAFVRDVTEQEATREALLRSEKLSSLWMVSAGLAHELKNPLSIISACSQFCLEQKPSPDLIADNFLLIYRNSLRANALINDLLDFARPAQIKREPVNIHSVLINMLMAAFLGKKKSENPVTYKTVYAKEMPFIMGDSDALTRVFLNIFNNAIDIGRNILIETHHIASQNVVRVDITDDGPGIPEENRSRIFDPFFTTKSGGSGLGLSISLKIVQEHGGAIKVAPGKRAGTTFSVMLPVAADGSNASVKMHWEQTPRQSRKPKEKKK